MFNNEEMSRPASSEWDQHSNWDHSQNGGKSISAIVDNNQEKAR